MTAFEEMKRRYEAWKHRNEKKNVEFPKFEASTAKSYEECWDEIHEENVRVERILRLSMIKQQQERERKKKLADQARAYYAGFPDGEPLDQGILGQINSIYFPGSCDSTYYNNMEKLIEDTIENNDWGITMDVFLYKDGEHSPSIDERFSDCNPMKVHVYIVDNPFYEREKK